MKYAPIQVLPDVPAGGVFAGIDWAVADHVACVVDMAGRILDRFSAAHDKAGIEMLIARLRRSGATEVAIERGDGVLVDALLAAGLRTDRARLRPLVPDTPATLALRAAVRARRDLVAHRVAACNQLRAHLAVAFPAAAGLFFGLASPISLRFLASFGSQDAAADLDEQAIEAWLKTIPERGKTAPRTRSSPRPWPRRSACSPPRSRSWRPGSASSWPPTPTRTSSPPWPGPACCAPPGCWPRSGTAGPATPARSPWPPWPGSPRSPASPARIPRMPSGGQSTARSATP